MEEDKVIPTKLTNDFANMGIDLMSLECFQINDPRFEQYKDEPVNFPSASWLRVVFPLEKNEDLRKFMVRFGGDDLRVGRLLEIMDLMAGRVGYSHCKSGDHSSDFYIVTASVDGIQFYPSHVPINKTVTLEVI